MPGFWYAFLLPNRPAPHKALWRYVEAPELTQALSTALEMKEKADAAQLFEARRRES